MKKKILLLALTYAFIFFADYATAQISGSTAYKFNVIKELPVTSVKNQSRTSTCWSFSTLSFIESELLRMGKGIHDLSEMFIVSNSYFDKSEKYIRTGGKINMAPGSSFGDALYVIKHYGIVPEEVMTGLNYGEEIHVHNEMDAALSGYIKAIERNPNGKLSSAWKSGVKGILNAYLGEIPVNFRYQDKEYSPNSFAASLGINPDEYVSLTSYTHHPFYSSFALEIPDNWRWDSSYNLPIDELVQVVNNSIEKGYTVLWASDVSEKGFTRKGIAVVPETDTKNMSGSDQERWLGLSRNEIDAKIYSLENVVKEKFVNQEIRQNGYDNLQTTDDHGMHIFGVARENNGDIFYMVKNSWGETGDYKGIWFVSETFLKYKTMNIVVHKNAIPIEIRKKLNL
ncbi:MAG: aminopeptidase [Bacteroidetes bacterium 41-46]|nr:MAG: aminopeptidase [Bacteroidetes bacterium 41-46]